MVKIDSKGFTKELKEVIEELKKKYGYGDHETTTWKINLVEKSIIEDNKKQKQLRDANK